MSRSLSWFDTDLLNALLAGSGVVVSSRHAASISFTDQRKPSTLVGQFGHTSRFAVGGPVSQGRFGQAVTKPEPPVVATASTAAASSDFDQKATRLAAGTPPHRTDPHPPPSEPAMPPHVAESSAAVRDYQHDADAGFEQQLASFMRWALEAMRQQRVFVADRDGLLLGDDGYSRAPETRAARVSAEGLAGAVCPALELALGTMEGVEHALAQGHVLLERADGPLTLVWANAPHGRLYVGLSGGAVPTPAVVAQVARTFRQLVALIAS